MSEFTMRTEIPASVEKVWRTISDFAAPEKYLPIVRNTVIVGTGVGSIRTLTMEDGNESIERLDEIDHENRSLKYTILNSKLLASSLKGRMTIYELGNNRCIVEWTCVFYPIGDAESRIVEKYRELFEIGFQGLKMLYGT